MPLPLFSCTNEQGNGEEKDNEAQSDEVQSEDGQSIEAIVYDFNTRTPLDGVVVTMSNGQVTTPVTTTSSTGKCNLPNVSSQNKYAFIKQGHVPQELNFVDFSNLDSVNLYLNQSTTQSMQMNLTGTTYNEAGNAIKGVRVSVGNNSTTSLQGGSYSFLIPGASEYQVNYKQGSVDATLNLIVDQDTARLDVYVSGFTIETDTSTVNK